MEETLKKLLYAGVGFAAQATEKFEQTIDELVEKGKLSDKEGKKIVDDFFAKSEKKKGDFETKFKKATEDVISNFNFAKQKDFEALEKKIAKLEKDMKKMTSTKKAATTKTTAAKKTTTKTAATV